MKQRLIRALIPGGIHYPQEHRRLRLFWLDGVLWNVAESFTLAYSALYALALGATTAQVGQLTSFSNLFGAIALLPGARVSEAWGQRKRMIVLFSGIGARLPLLLLALVPFFFAGPAAVYAVIALLGLRNFTDNFAKPAHTSFVADIVPLRLRGRYFSSRNFAMGVVAFITVPVMGFLIRGFSDTTGYQWAWFICFLSAVASAVAFSTIPEPQTKPVETRQSEGDLLREMVKQRPFLAFALAGLVWSLSVQLAGPFFNVFMLRELQLNAATIGVLTTVTNVTSLIGQRWWGMRYGKLGDMGIFRITGLIIPFMPFIWAVATSAWHVAFINLMGGFIWSGYTLAQFNLLLSLTPERGRERYVAVYQTCIFLSAFVAPLLGAWLSDWMGFRALFALSGVGRLAATVLFFRLMAFRSTESERRQNAANSSD